MSTFQAARKESKVSDTATSSHIISKNLNSSKQTIDNWNVQQLVRSGILKTKLKISHPNDPYEGEADRIADEVMRMSQETVAPSGAKDLTVYRKCKRCEEEEKKKIHRKTSGMNNLQVPEDVAQDIDNLRGRGSPLDIRTRAFMESRFGYDFSRVRIHTDQGAARLAEAIGALAFTKSNDIIFGAGLYAPVTAQGKRLLAHELTHVVQQESSREMGSPIKLTRINRADDPIEKEADIVATRVSAGEHVRIRLTGAGIALQENDQNLQTRLDEIERRYRSMIADARSRGANVAADNLERYLVGTGGVKTENVAWLRGFEVVTDAERENQERFENSLNDKANEMVDRGINFSVPFCDYWDKKFTASTRTELYYASGTSSIRSSGRFILRRSGKMVTIDGTVSHHWCDPYDWHAGLAAYIPGYGTVSDEDALLLQQHRGAKPFLMEANWSQTLTGKIEVGLLYNTRNFSWGTPSAGGSVISCPWESPPKACQMPSASSVSAGSSGTR